ncbi:hypothetical protein BDW67DRAFT_19435 [Aspergillus spinulosporus]
MDRDHGLPACPTRTVNGSSTVTMSIPFLSAAAAYAVVALATRSIQVPRPSDTPPPSGIGRNPSTTQIVLELFSR